MDLRLEIESQVKDGTARVFVVRQQPGSSLTVSSLTCQPIGRAYRFRQEVNPELVQAEIEKWLAALPEDYCLRPECRDQLGHHWQKLRDLLAAIPCVEAEVEA
tara:strand:- start:291 stop:599 length:309 start_codon:yes stop_codon:yes gene_type:complete